MWSWMHALLDFFGRALGFCKVFWLYFSPTAECYGVFAQYRFRCVLGALGSSRKEPGSGNRFRELVPGTSSGNWIRVSMGSDRFCGSKVRVQKVAWKRFRRFPCLMGSEGLGSVPEVLTEPGTRGIKKVRGQGFQQLLCTSKVYSCTLKVYFCTLKVCFCTLKVYLLCFARVLFYVESIFL